MRYVEIRNKTRGTELGAQIGVADSFLSRFLGLMFRRSLAEGSGLLIVPSSGVHTFWMRMPIDVIGLDRANRVVKLGEAVRPWRLSCLGTRVAKIVELPPGAIARSHTRIGDELEHGQSAG